jgi:hypothetical protein
MALKLTPYQRKKLYKYWRSQGYTVQQAKNQNSIWKAFEHHARIARTEPQAIKPSKKHKPPAIQLTPTQLQGLKVKQEKTGLEIPASFPGMNGREKLRYHARVRGWLNAIRERTGKNPKHLLWMYKDNLQHAEVEKQIYTIIQASYSSGALPPKIELTESGSRKLRE